MALASVCIAQTIRGDKDSPLLDESIFVNFPQYGRVATMLGKSSYLVGTVREKQAGFDQGLGDASAQQGYYPVTGARRII